jgi:hypothetical protein
MPDLENMGLGMATASIVISVSYPSHDKDNIKRRSQRCSANMAA